VVISVWSEVQPAGDLHVVQLIPLPSLGLTVLVPAYPGCPGKEAIERVSVCQSSANGKVSKV